MNTDLKAYVGVILADMHWGKAEPKEYFKSMKKLILDKLKAMPILDFIVIAGDYYHSKLSMASDNARYSGYFMAALLEIAYEKSAKVRVIEGTKSHDNNQWALLDVFITNGKYDVKIIQTVASEQLFDDMNVLYIPEEYMPNKDEYYKDAFSKEYDMIFAHGLINEVAFVASKQEGEITRSDAPVFKSDTLISICKGPIFFGHIHTPQVIKGKIFYVGTPDRWCFGEEEDKGFYITTYSPENGKFLTEFVINKDAKRFDTVIIDYSSSFFKDEEKQQIEFLVKMVDSLTVNKLRIIVNIPEDYPNGELLTKLIHEIGKYPNVKVVINNNSKLRQKKDTDDKIKKLLDKYGLIFDGTKTYEEKISEYIKIKYNKNISVEKIRHYLYEKILEGDSTYGK